MKEPRRVTAPSSRSSLDQQVGHLTRLLARALLTRISPLGVVPGQFAQLLALFEKDGLTQAELCDQVRIEQPTMAKTLVRMERDGLIRRSPDPTDGRRASVLLTDRARRLEGDLVDSARNVNRAATQGIGEEELATFMDLMGRIIDNLESER
jgi:DNA-binding MarR family transcriptional regulator